MTVATLAPLGPDLSTDPDNGRTHLAWGAARDGVGAKETEECWWRVYYNAADWETATTVDGLTTSYTYDAAGQRIGTTTSDGATATTLGYDPEGRVTSIAENAGGTGPYATRYGYNADHLPTTLTYPNNTSASLGYDANSQLRTLTATGPTQVPATTTLTSAYAYGYNATGWITRTTTLLGTDAITHDASGRLTDECRPQLVTPHHCDQ